MLLLCCWIISCLIWPCSQSHCGNLSLFVGSLFLFFRQPLFLLFSMGLHGPPFLRTPLSLHSLTYSLAVYFLNVHAEHCVFCRFLSSGNSYKDCGHPCEKHKVHLRDEKGDDHLVLADMGCRNTVFNAQAQSGAFYAQDLVRSGIRHFRIELVR